MGVSLMFGFGLATPLLVSLVVVRYLSLPLRRQLEELCGDAKRADFWSAFSNVTLALVPVIFAMSFPPQPESGLPPLLAMTGQVRFGLIGLVVSVLMLGWVLGRFIPRPVARRTSAVVAAGAPDANERGQI
jgi:hypothetical protein